MGPAQSWGWRPGQALRHHPEAQPARIGLGEASLGLSGTASPLRQGPDGAQHLLLEPLAPARRDRGRQAARMQISRGGRGTPPAPGIKGGVRRAGPQKSLPPGSLPCAQAPALLPAAPTARSSPRPPVRTRGSADTRRGGEPEAPTPRLRRRTRRPTSPRSGRASVRPRDPSPRFLTGNVGSRLPHRALRD